MDAARLWQAHPSLRSVAEQRRASVAAAVLLAIAAFGAAILPVPLLTGNTAMLGVVLATLAAVLAGYSLVRSGHLNAGIVVGLAATELAIFAARAAAVGDAQPHALLYFLGIPILVAGLLLRVSLSAVVAGLTAAAALGVETVLDDRFATGFDSEDISLAIFLAGVAAVAIAAAALMQRQSRLLDESTELLRQVAENIPEVFFVVAPDLRKAYYGSPAYETLWGRPVAGFMADPLDWLKAVHPEDLPRVRAGIQADPLGEAQFRIVQPSGAIRHMRSRVFPVPGPGGAVARLVGIVEDVTAVKVATDLLREANEKLRSAAGERQRMFQQIAHDLANPLNPIVLHLAILDRAGPDADFAKSLPVIKRNIEALRRQVEDLRDLARVEGGGLRLQPAPLDLAAVAGEAVASFEANARERGITLAGDCAAPVPLVADRARLLQVLYNLLGNAIKFTPAGGTVTLRCAADGQEAVVSVKDSGRGLDPEEAARLFMPFSQVHAPGEVAERGIGLGLYISKGIVEAHGGTIGVTSEARGRGATFTFRLPLRPPGTP
ncbi:MAG: hypothetical protein QOG31_1517 [Thermoplasmata archaeon]|jgi:signal transduction histidine kinase|nr:hypothetical protein [Thermoplasmata archaeon]